MRNNMLTAHYMLIVSQVAMHMLPFQIFTRAPVLLSAWPLPIPAPPAFDAYSRMVPGSPQCGACRSFCTA